MPATLAANCDTAQPRRAGDPSGQAISDALFGSNNINLNNVCAGSWPPGSQTTSTFNTGSLIYNVTRADPTQDLRYCQDAFKDIIQQCIVEANYWGGEWDLNGETYTITDQGWPEHVLPSDLSPSNSQSSGSNGGASPATSTTVTTTINGSPITETFVPTTIAGITKATTTSTTIDGVLVPLILGPLGVGWIPFIPVGGIPPVPITPPEPPGGEGGDDNPTSTTTSTTSSSSSSSSQPSLSHTQTEGYLVAACGRDAGAAARTTTFTTKGTATPPAQTVTTNCAVCVLPHGSVDPACNPIPGCVPSGSSTGSSTSSSPAVAATTTPTAVFPTATGVNCGSSSAGGSRLADCLSIMGGVAVPNDDTQICTNDQSKCLASGESVGGDPQTVTSNYCEIGQNSGCAIVIANKLSTFGFPGL